MAGASFPTHLHGIVKVETENQSPSFEFFVKDRDDALHSRTWRTDNADSWVYTFHSFTKKNRQYDHSPPVIGQMQVSYLSSEILFVLYKIVQARRRFLVEDHMKRYCISSSYLEKLTSYPWSPADLCPQLETATIVIQNSAIVKVITPSGMHGVPEDDECGPSTLLDRWRFGGGCDCEGWDMGCPVLVFDSVLDDDGLIDCLRSESNKPILFYNQASKDKIPALSVRAGGKGIYLVDFNAQLSALQAFSICVAILHSSDELVLVEEEVMERRLERISLSLLNPPFSPIS